MEAVTIKLVAAGILFTLTLASGAVLSHASRPLSVGLVTLHKLIALGALVFAGLAIYQLYKTMDAKAFIGMAALVTSVILALALIATGALLTREEMQLPGLVLMIHRVAPLLALATSSLTVYLFAGGKS